MLVMQGGGESLECKWIIVFIMPVLNLVMSCPLGLQIAGARVVFYEIVYVLLPAPRDLLLLFRL